MDGDGFPSFYTNTDPPLELENQHGGPDWDCDDSDPTIHPEAEDLPGDGIDQNCDDVDGVQ